APYQRGSPAGRWQAGVRTDAIRTHRRRRNLARSGPWAPAARAHRQCAPADRRRGTRGVFGLLTSRDLRCAVGLSRNAREWYGILPHLRRLARELRRMARFALD